MVNTSLDRSKKNERFNSSQRHSVQEQFLYLFDNLKTPEEKALIGLIGVRHNTSGVASHPLQDEMIVCAIRQGAVDNEIVDQIRERLLWTTKPETL